MSHRIDTSKNKYILYARKSSESDERQVASTPDQVRAMTRQTRNEPDVYKIKKTFEEQKSGFIPYRREKFDEMIRMLQDGEAQGIITWKMSRLSRNPEESGIIMGMLQRGEIKHIYTADRSYYPEDNVLMTAFELAVSNQSSLDTSKDTRRGLSEKVERGWCPHSVLPIGYEHVEYLHPGIDPEILPDPDRFDLFRQGVMHIIEGKMEPMEAYSWLAEQGLRTKKTKKRPERILPESTFYRLLGDRFYIGEFTHKGEVYEGKHKHMFTDDEFDRLQSMLGRKDRTRPKKHFFPFAGLMKCGECGCSIIADPTNKKRSDGSIKRYVHYHCTKKRGNCDQRTLNVDKLEEQFEELLDRIEIPESFHKWAIEQLRSEHTEEVEQRKLTKDRNRKLLDEVEQKLDRLLDLKLAGDVTDEEYRAKKPSLERDKKDLKKLVDNTHDRQDEWIDIMEKAMDFAQTARVRFAEGDPHTKKEIIFNLGSNFVLYDRIVSLDMDSPLKLVERVAPEVKKVNKRLELSKKTVEQSEVEVLYSQNLIMGG